MCRALDQGIEYSISTIHHHTSKIRMKQYFSFNGPTLAYRVQTYYSPKLSCLEQDSYPRTSKSNTDPFSPSCFELLTDPLGLGNTSKWFLHWLVTVRTYYLVNGCLEKNETWASDFGVIVLNYGTHLVYEVTILASSQIDENMFKQLVPGQCGCPSNGPYGAFLCRPLRSLGILSLKNQKMKKRSS